MAPGVAIVWVVAGTVLKLIDVEYAPIPMDPFREPPGAQSTPTGEGS